MKRVDERGASFKKKQAREKQKSRNGGAIIQFLVGPDNFDGTDVTAKAHRDEVQLEKR